MLAFNWMPLPWMKQGLRPDNGCWCKLINTVASFCLYNNMCHEKLYTIVGEKGYVQACWLLSEMLWSAYCDQIEMAKTCFLGVRCTGNESWIARLELPSWSWLHRLGHQSMSPVTTGACSQALCAVEFQKRLACRPNMLGPILQFLPSLADIPRPAPEEVGA